MFGGQGLRTTQPVSAFLTERSTFYAFPSLIRRTQTRTVFPGPPPCPPPRPAPPPPPDPSRPSLRGRAGNITGPQKREGSGDPHGKVRIPTKRPPSPPPSPTPLHPHVAQLIPWAPVSQPWVVPGAISRNPKTVS